jgi:Dynamin family
MDELRTYADRRLELGDMVRAALHLARGLKDAQAEVPLAQVAAYIAQASATRAEQQVVSAEVEVPAEILRLGFEFIDTPGVGSAIEINTATTRRFLPQADAVIFVIGFDSPLTQAEAGFLADAARHVGKLFLVLNKRDLVSGQDADMALEFVRNRLREDLGMSGPRLFPLSALQAMEAVVHGDGGQLAASGLPDLHAELREFLTAGKTRLFLRNIAGRAAALVAGQQRGLRLGRLALDGGPGPEAVLAAFDARMADLDRQRSVIAARSPAGSRPACRACSPPGALPGSRGCWSCSPRLPRPPCLPGRWTARSAICWRKPGRAWNVPAVRLSVAGWNGGRARCSRWSPAWRRGRLLAGAGPVSWRGGDRGRRPGRRG